ncbi:MAG: hypothetical protein ABWZ40_08025 [Caulobacterales bacterium]
MTNKNWLADLELGDGIVVVKKTGVRIPVNLALIHEVVHWLAYYGTIELWRLVSGFKPGPRFKVGFTPERPRPWYLLWPVLQTAGARIVSDLDKSDLVFHFDDSTISPPGQMAKTGPRGRPIHFNFNCTDVSKTRVTRAFEEAFGYSLAVDPRSSEGPAVEKSEDNGVHDGRIVHTPVEPLRGRVYQKLIDNQIRDGVVADLRTPTIGGRPICVFIKERPIDHRFSNDNTRVTLHRIEDIFSPGEIECLTRFANALSLDWGGLDVLRDRNDGRIYVVDANKTDMGPPLLLPLRQKLQATRWLSDAFTAFAKARTGTL